MGAFAGKSGSSDKKSGGIIGGLKKLGGAAVNVLGAPQQFVFRTGAGLGALLEGEGKAALGHFGHAAGEIGSLGQMGGDIDFARAITKEKDARAGNIRKLPKGLNMTANLLLDPLLFTAIGKGAEAGKGLSTLAKIGAGGNDAKAVSAAIKSGALDLSKGSAARNVLTQELIAGGSKAKQAEKIAKLTARRGGGGLTAFVPGTELSHTIKSADKLADAGRAVKGAVGSTKLGRDAGVLAQKAFKPGAELARGLGDSRLAATIRQMGEYRQTNAAAKADDLLHELRNATEMVGRQLDDVDDAEMLKAMETGPAGVADLLVRKPELEPLVKVVERVRNETTQRQLKAGVLDNVHNGDEYMQRLLTPETAEVAKKGSNTAKGMLASDVAGSVSAALKQGAEKGRSIFPNMPANVINELKAAVDANVPLANLIQQPAFAKFVKGMDPDALDVALRDFEKLAKELPQGAKFYQESALASLLNRSAGAERAIQAKHYVNDLMGLVDQSGAPLLLDEAGITALHKSGKGLPNGWVKEELPHVGTIAGPKELLKEMKNVTGRVARDDFIGDFEKAMNAWQKFWKTHATTGVLGSLPFAMRNGRSNIYLMMTEGMTPVEVARYMKEAKQLEDKVRTVLGTARVSNKFVGQHADEVARTGVDATLRSKLTAHEYELWRAMQKEGITTRGFFDVDFSDDVFAKVRKVTGQKEDIGRARKLAKDVISPEGGMARKGRDLNQAVETNARMAAFLYNMDKYGTVVEAARRTKAVLFDYNELTEFEKRVMKNIIPFYTFMRKNIPLQMETLIKNPTRIVVPEKISEAVTGDLPEGSPEYMQEGGARTLPGILPLFGGQISTPDRPFHAAFDTLSPLALAARGQGKEAARAAANVPSGPQVNLLRALTEIGTGKDAFTGGNVQPGIAAGLQRLAGSQMPSLGRLPRVGVGPVNPSKVLTGKTEKPIPNELLRLLLGLRVEQPK